MSEHSAENDVARTCWYGEPCRDTRYCIHPDHTEPGGCRPPAAPPLAFVPMPRVRVLAHNAQGRLRYTPLRGSVIPPEGGAQ